MRSGKSNGWQRQSKFNTSFCSLASGINATILNDSRNLSGKADEEPLVALIPVC